VINIAYGNQLVCFFLVYLLIGTGICPNNEIMGAEGEQLFPFLDSLHRATGALKEADKATGEPGK
jgi:hypothetical protein